jgi:hypothetical protein
VAVKKICEIRKTLSCCLAYPSARFTRKKPLYPLFSSSWQARQIRPTRQPERFQTRFSGVSHSARADGVLNPAEQSNPRKILSGLLADKGGAAQISTAMRVLAAD